MATLEQLITNLDARVKALEEKALAPEVINARTKIDALNPAGSAYHNVFAPSSVNGEVLQAADGLAPLSNGDAMGNGFQPHHSERPLVPPPAYQSNEEEG